MLVGEKRDLVQLGIERKCETERTRDTLTNRLLSRHFGGGGGGGDTEYNAHLVLVRVKFDLLAFFAVVRE